MVYQGRPRLSPESGIRTRALKLRVRDRLNIIAVFSACACALRKMPLARDMSRRIVAWYGWCIRVHARDCGAVDWWGELHNIFNRSFPVLKAEDPACIYEL